MNSSMLHLALCLDLGMYNKCVTKAESLLGLNLHLIILQLRTG